MAVPTYEPHVLIAFGGPMAESKEIWSCSLRCQPRGGPYTAAENQELAQGFVKDAIATYIGNSSAPFIEDVQLSYVKVNNIAEDGKYSDPTTSVYYWDDPLPGGTGGRLTPYQVSMVASLTSPGRGPGTHGRWYQPPQVLGTMILGQVSGDYADTNLSVAQTLVESLKGVDSFGYEVGIFSSKGPWSIASTLRMGLVPDTQRRRRNALVEDYHDVSIS